MGESYIGLTDHIGQLLSNKEEIVKDGYQKLLISTTLEYLWRNPMCGKVMGQNRIKEHVVTSILCKLALYTVHECDDIDVDHPNSAPHQFLLGNLDILDSHLPAYQDHYFIFFKSLPNSKVWLELERDGVLERFVARYTSALLRKLGYTYPVLKISQSRSIIEQAQIIWWMEYDNAWKWIARKFGGQLLPADHLVL